MAKRDLVIGLDIGTTSVKAVLFDFKGNVIEEREKKIMTYHPQSDWAEQDPDEIESQARLVLKEMMNEINPSLDKLHAVGLSCAMHSLICIDENHQPLSRAIIWSDGRSSDQAEKILHSNYKDVYMRTGTPIHPMSPLLKLMWMKEVGYDPYLKARYFMTVKEYLLLKWFGQRVVDYSMASSTGLLNLNSLDWDEEALNLAGIEKEQLSTIVVPTKIIKAIGNKDFGNVEWELPEIPVVVGAADGQLANLGSGAILPGEVNISVGTSGAIRQFAKGFPINENKETFTYAFTENNSIIGGASNNGGIALQWAKDLLEFQGTHDEFVKGAEQIEPGADGLLFHPYVNGERAPLWNQHAKGNFYGLHLAHRRSHMVRAILEGISFNIYQISLSLEKLVGKPHKITVNGGLSKSKLWVQIMADIFGQDIYVSETHHNAAWGAAWTALVAIGKAESFAAIKENLPMEHIVVPDLTNTEKYRDIYKKYVSIGNFLKENFYIYHG